MGDGEWLLYRYLDGLASNAEAAELGRLLAARPALADAFARAARAEATLTDYFRERRATARMTALLAPPAPVPIRRSRLLRRGAAVAAGLLLLAVGAGVLAGFWTGRPQPRPGDVIAGRVLVDGVEAATVPEGARVQVAGDTAARIRLPDGSESEFGPGSEAVLVRGSAGGWRVVELGCGGGTFQVGAGAQPVRVNTPIGSVDAKGGSFAVELRPPAEEEGEAMSEKGTLVLVVAALVGPVEVHNRGGHFVLAPGQSKAFAADGKAAFAKPSCGGEVVAISADGKRLTLETPPAKPGGAAQRHEVTLTERTEVEYFNVGADGRKPTVGYSATVWLEAGSADRAARIRLGHSERILTGKIVAVAEDGKQFTLEWMKGDRAVRVPIRIAEGAKLVHRDPKGVAKPAVGVVVRVWLKPGSADLAGGIQFGAEAEPPPPEKPTGKKPAVGKPSEPSKPKPKLTEPGPGDTPKPKPKPKSVPGGKEDTAWTAPAVTGPWATRDLAPVVASIDEEWTKALAAAKVTAAPEADDAEFLRRVTLDLTGRIPPYAQTVAFLADKDPAKRRKLIDTLLASPAYGQHFAAVWKDVLVPEEAGGKPRPDHFSPWLAEQFNRGRGWDAIVTDLLTVEGVVNRTPQSAFLMAHGEGQHPQPRLLADATARLFWGVQLRCAECHDHPFAKWKQDDFWATAAFFTRLRNDSPKGGPNAALTEAAEPGKPHPARASIAIPATVGKGSGKVVPARFLDGRELAAGDGPLRPRLAAWATAAENPYFAANAVNRWWAHLFGRGLAASVDPSEAVERPTHPELLKRLAAAFTASGSDPRFLLRCICNSKAYQRSSRPASGTPGDPRWFGHMAAKPLRPEVLYDSLALVFAADRSIGGGKKVDPWSVPLDWLPAKERGGFLRAFRQPSGDGADAPGMTVPQRLRLMNGASFNRTAPVVEGLAEGGVEPAVAVETLFLRVLARRPELAEAKLMVDYLARKPDAKAGLTGVLWALLNTSEFTLNH